MHAACQRIDIGSYVNAVIWTDVRLFIGLSAEH